MDAGIWLPEHGVAINAHRAGAPAFATCPEVLRQIGRRSGVLATQSTWSAAFPKSRVPRAPAPDHKDLRLGVLTVGFIRDPLLEGVYHLRVHTPAHVFCAISVAGDSPWLPPTDPELVPGDVNLVGPWTHERPCDEARAAALRQWAGSSEVFLYGDWFRSRGAPPRWVSGNALRIARLPVQSLLF